MKKLIMLAAMAVALVGCGFNGRPGTGEKVGQIVKVEKTGVLRKTWEAELIRGGMSNGSGGFGVAPFHFTIESESDAKKALDLMQSQTEVHLKYRSEFFFSLMRSDSGGDFLTSLEPAKP